MSFRVGVTYAGDIAIVNADGARYDLSPDDARRTAADIRAQIKRGGDIVFTSCQAKQGRAFRYCGNLDSAEQLAADLERGAAHGPSDPSPEDVA